MRLTNRRELYNYLQSLPQRMEEAIVQNLQYLGEQLVNHARDYPGRDGGGFKDQTGNLRNSIGYVIGGNGRVLSMNFKTSIPSGTIGKQKGEEVARQLISTHLNGYVLIMVAGMEYAMAVEARGQNVLTASKQLGAEKLPELKQRLTRAIERITK